RLILPLLICGLLAMKAMAPSRVVGLVRARPASEGVPEGLAYRSMGASTGKMRVRLRFDSEVETPRRGSGSGFRLWICTSKPERASPLSGVNEVEQLIRAGSRMTRRENASPVDSGPRDLVDRPSQRQADLRSRNNTPPRVYSFSQCRMLTFARYSSIPTLPALALRYPSVTLTLHWTRMAFSVRPYQGPN